MWQLANLYANLNRLSAENFLSQIAHLPAEQAVVRRIAQGEIPKAVVSQKDLAQLAIAESGCTPELWQKCLELCGNQQEVVGLLPGQPLDPQERSLGWWLDWIGEISLLDKDSQLKQIVDAWRKLWPSERILLNKLLTGRSLFTTRQPPRSEAKAVKLRLWLVLSYIRYSYRDFDTELTLAAADGDRMHSVAKINLSQIPEPYRQMVSSYVDQQVARKIGPVSDLHPGLLVEITAQELVSQAGKGYRLQGVEVIQAIVDPKLANLTKLDELAAYWAENAPRG